jgi:hypothetical protein
MLFLIPIAFAVIAWLVFATRAHQGTMDRVVAKLYREGGNPGVLGEHELQFDGAHLIERSPVSELTTRLEGIQKVVRTDQYTFVYLGAVAAHVIPRNRIEEGDFATFSAALAAATTDCLDISR